MFFLKQIHFLKTPKNKNYHISKRILSDVCYNIRSVVYQ